MSKTIFIGGRLESKEKGNVVAGANAILDDTKGKKQNVINKETDDELLRLEQSKQDNLTFDNAPTEDSTNPVTSGGVYTAEKALSDAIEAILLLIPSAATALNKLVDTNTMNSSISTATATFRGTYNAVSDLGLTYQATHAQIEAALDALGLTADNNDYAFVQVPVSDQSQDIAKTERYKNNGTNWQYEYDLNTSGFTAAQWGAINSTITLALVQKLAALPTNAELLQALGLKQDVLTFDNAPTTDSNNPVKSGGIKNAIDTAVGDEATARENADTALGGLIGDEQTRAEGVEGGLNNRLGAVEGSVTTIQGVIPSEATSSNKLVDNNSMTTYIGAIIDNIDATFNVTSTDGHVTLAITQVNGVITSVQLTTSDIASAAVLNLKASQADLTALAGRVTTAEGNITSLTWRVSTNETDIANLQQLYNNLQQSQPVPVTSLPSSGQQQGIIYRLAGTTSYSDYMWNGSTWVLMATYNNAIDDEPIAGSENLVKSGGVFELSLYNQYITDGWENQTGSGMANLTRVSIFIPVVDMTYKIVKAPSGYKVSLSADKSLVWNGTDWSSDWSTSNIDYESSLDLSSIDFSGKNIIGFTIKAVDESIIPVSVGSNVIFCKNLADTVNEINSVVSGEGNSDLLRVAKNEIFNNYGNLDSLNNAKIGSTYIIQRTSSTTTTDFPEDYNTSGLSILTTYKVYYSETKYQLTQVLFNYSLLTYWRRGYNSDTQEWGSWQKYSAAPASESYFLINEKQIFDSYAQEVLSDLNDAADNRLYICQRTSGTTTANFPSDYTSGFALLYCFKAYYSNSKYQQIQILNKIGDDVVWMRAKNSDGDWTAWQLRSTNADKTFTVGQGQQYTTLKDAITEAIKYKNSTVIVMPGTYDLVTEFSNDISSSMGIVGLGLGNGIHVIFRDGAKVTALFDNSEETYDATTWRRIYDYFNPFYSRSVNGNADFILENANIECSNTRYCVHDEMSGVGIYMHKYINCKMKYTNNHEDINYVPCIGGGLGEHGTIVIDGGIYQSVPNYGVVSVGGDAANSQMCITYHNGSNSTCESSITIKNVYLKDRGYFLFSYYGNSTIKSQIEICGCSTGLPTLKKAEGSSLTDNIEITEWNENLRNPSHWVVSPDGRTAELVEEN